jgi:hypothetical protein
MIFDDSTKKRESVLLSLRDNETFLSLLIPTEFFFSLSNTKTMSIILNFCLFPNHHIIFYCITLSLSFSPFESQFLGISLLLLEFCCGVEHCCNKSDSHKNLLNRTLSSFGLLPSFFSFLM